MRLLTLCLVLIGCATLPSHAAPDLRTPVSTITITNDYRDDLRVWVVHSTERHRQLGTVPRYEKKVFVLEEGDFNQATLQMLTVSTTEGVSNYTEEVVALRGGAFRLQVGPQQGEQFLYRAASR
jgi:hypothetical protein